MRGLDQLRTRKESAEQDRPKTIAGATGLCPKGFSGGESESVLGEWECHRSEAAGIPALSVIPRPQEGT